MAESAEAHARDKNSSLSHSMADTKWLKINAKNFYLGFDNFRNVYAKLIVFRPTLFG